MPIYILRISEGDVQTMTEGINGKEIKLGNKWNYTNNKGIQKNIYKTDLQKSIFDSLDEDKRGKKNYERRTEADGSVREIQYNENGKKKYELMTNPDGWKQETKYDDSGKIMSSRLTNRDGSILDIQYDENEKIKSARETSPDGTVKNLEIDERGMIIRK